MAFEFLYARKNGRQIYSWKENIITVCTFVISYLSIKLSNTFPINWKLLFTWAQNHFEVPEIARLWPTSPWLHYLLLFILVDLSYYWLHRLSHTINLFWTSHFTHHTITKLNVLAAHRDPLRLWRFNLFVLLIPFLVQFPKSALLEFFNLFLCVSIYSTWMHCTLIPKLKYVDYVFNTPSQHRMHHCMSVQERMFHVNFGGVLIIWDRLFGTYLEENQDVRRYGVPGFDRPANFFHILFHQWYQFLKQLGRCRSLRDVFSTFFWDIRAE